MRLEVSRELERNRTRAVAVLRALSARAPDEAVFAIDCRTPPELTDEQRKMLEKALGGERDNTGAREQLKKAGKL